MPSVYTTPRHLRPVELWRLRLATSEAARATLSPATTSVPALQDAVKALDRTPLPKPKPRKPRSTAVSVAVA